MKAEIEAAIKALIQRATEAKANADDAMKFSQAALNLSHAAATFHNMK